MENTITENTITENTITENTITNLIRKLLNGERGWSSLETEPGKTYSIYYGYSNYRFESYEVVNNENKKIKVGESGHTFFPNEIIEIFYDNNGSLTFEVHGASRFSRTMNAYTYDIKKYVNGYRKRLQNASTTLKITTTSDPDQVSTQAQNESPAQQGRNIITMIEPTSFYPLLTANQIMQIDQIFDERYSYIIGIESCEMNQFKTKLIITINLLLEDNFKTNNIESYKKANELVQDIITCIESGKAVFNSDNLNINLLQFSNHIEIYSDNRSKNIIIDLNNSRIINNIGGSDDFQGGGKVATKKLMKTIERFKHKNRNYVVYVGPRGGRYIKTNGQYKSVSKL